MKRSLLVAAAVLPPVVVLVGCGGGGDGIVTPTAVPTSTPGPTPTLTGNTAIRGALTTGYQGYRSQVNYPIRGLMIALPSTSPFKAQTGALKRVAATLDYYSELGLYVSQTTSGNVTTINAYTDAAGKQSAGSATLTAPKNTTPGGNYTSYPAVVELKINITGGNIPCQGTGTLTFTGPSGANTLTGQLLLTKTGVTSTANLTLSNSGQVGGTITFKENGQITTLSNLSGSLAGDINGIASVSPTGATGTGVVNLFAGKYQITLKNSTGTATANANPTTGALSVTFPDGTQETLPKPLDVVGGVNPNPTTGPTTAPTTSPTTKPTTAPTAAPTTRPTTAPLVYGAPVQLSGVAPKGVNNAGQIVGNDIQNQISPIFLASATAQPQNLLNVGRARAINNKGSILVVGQGNSAIFEDASKPPTPLRGKVFTYGLGLNDADQVVGEDIPGTSTGDQESPTPNYWGDPAKPAVSLQLLAGNQFGEAGAINSNGLIVGQSDLVTPYPRELSSRDIPTPVYWTSASAQPKALPAFPSSHGYSTYGVNARGQVFGSGTSVSAFWPSLTAQPIALPDLTGSRNGASILAFGMSDNGIVVGYDYISQSAGEHAVRWVNGQVQDLNSLIPANSGWVLQRATGISGNGQVVGTGTYKGQAAGFYMSPVAASPLHSRMASIR